MMRLKISIDGSAEEVRALRRPLIQDPDVRVTMKIGDAETIVARAGPDRSETVSEHGHSLDLEAFKIYGDGHAKPCWSSTPPTKAGWYWMRDGDEVEEPVQVLDDGDVLRAGFEFEEAPGSNCSFWSEPLEPPK